MSGRTLRKLFLTFFFFYGTAKSICELRHTFFINLRLRQILNLRYPALFYKNLRSAAGKFAHSVVCGNTYAPPGIIITRHNTGTELALLFCFVFFCLKQKQQTGNGFLFYLIKLEETQKYPISSISSNGCVWRFLFKLKTNIIGRFCSAVWFFPFEFPYFHSTLV